MNEGSCEKAFPGGKILSQFKKDCCKGDAVLCHKIGAIEQPNLQKG
jgi:hypothetical protein